MGWLLKFISFRSISFQLGGACAAPLIERSISSGPITLNIADNHPISKIAILRRQRFFSPERRSKVVNFAKNDRLESLIVLAKNERYIFSLENGSKGVPLNDFATLGSILDSQLSWESGKLQMARSSHRVVLFLVRTWPTRPDQPDGLVWKVLYLSC